MSRKIPKPAISLLLSILMLFSGICLLNVYAEDDPPALDAGNVVIKGAHAIENKDYISNLHLKFILTAKDSSNPMPDGSLNGKKEVVIDANSEFNFGRMSFPKEGTYEYTVSREDLPGMSLDQDESVYNIQIAVFSDNTAVMVIKKQGEDGKCDKITYTDKYVQTFSIRYKLSGGTINGSSEDIVEEHPIGSIITIKEAPIKEGYEFDYWQGSKHYPGDQYEVVDDHVFTAIYKESKTTQEDNPQKHDKDDNSKGEKVKRGVRTGDDTKGFLFAGAFASAALCAVASRRKKYKE